MKTLTIFFSVLFFLSTSAFGQNPKLTGFNNYTKWIDKNKDNTLSAKELVNLDEFVLNDKSAFSFIVMIPPPKSFWTLKIEKIPSQNFIIEAKDNDSGMEWKVYESFCNRGKINFFEMKPISGNITLTCTYTESNIKRSLTYNYQPEHKELDQHLNYYLSKEQIQTYSELNEEKINTYKNSKTASLVVFQDYSYIYNFELPFKKIAERLVVYAGLTIADNGNTTPDLQIVINTHGNSTWLNVRMKDINNSYQSVDIATDVSIYYTIIFKHQENIYYANDFNWHKKFDRTETEYKGSRMVQHIPHIANNYSDIFYEGSFLKDFGEMLTSALELDPVKFYLNASEDENESISFHAVELIGELRDTSAFAPLVRIYENESRRKRVAAIYALGELQDLRSMDLLLDALVQKDSYIRLTAAKALGKLNSLRAVEPLILALDDENYFVVSNAAQALGQLGDNRAVKPLILSIEKVAKSALNGVIIALGDLGDPLAIEPIIPLLKKKRYKIEAQNTLVQLTGIDNGKKYKDWKNWWNEHKSKYIHE
ncbi:MAG: HEAT repeat domain-containing protein [Bacteroidales bacterium]|nr:HEAT repeat domain-containing protein [Bacteroidales bacterium]